MHSVFFSVVERVQTTHVQASEPSLSRPLRGGMSMYQGGDPKKQLLGAYLREVCTNKLYLRSE